MVDFIIGLGVGYFLKAILTPQMQHDVLLAWDPDSLGWRSVPPGTSLHPDKRYLAAIAIEYSGNQDNN